MSKPTGNISDPTMAAHPMSMGRGVSSVWVKAEDVNGVSVAFVKFPRTQTVTIHLGDERDAPFVELDQQWLIDLLTRKEYLG